MVSMDNNFYLCLILWFLFSYAMPSASNICGGRDGIVCCSGYMWNEAENNCTRCTEGFYGRECEMTCPYPTFGWNCRSECNCSIENCHRAYGCRRRPSECETGKYGDYCQLSCRYPNYGKKCQLFCFCDEVSCDPSIGCTGFPTFYNIKPSTHHSSTPSMTFESSTHHDVITEATPKSTNIFHMGKTCAEKNWDENESNSTSYIAGIISLLIVAGLLLILYALTFLHKTVSAAQRDTARINTL